MARDKGTDDISLRPVRRLLVGGTVVVLLLFFLVWRIDSPRVERFRSAFIDGMMPAFNVLATPATKVADMVENFQSYTRIFEQNQELRRELQQMKAWREAALQLEQENAKLLDLNNVRLDPKLTYVTGVVKADSGSSFRQSVILNIGARDGIMDGWAAMDGIGLVGRISGVGASTSRVILLTDSNSRVPVTIQPSGQRAMIAGDNTATPYLDFLEAPELVRPGDRAVSSGDGQVFPSDLLVGQVLQARDGRLRIRLAADFERLDFLRVLRSRTSEPITDPGRLVVPVPPSQETPPLASAEPEGGADG